MGPSGHATAIKPLYKADPFSSDQKTTRGGSYLTCTLTVEPEVTLAISDAGTDVEEPQAIILELTSVTGSSDAIWRIGVFMLKVPAWSTGAGPS